MARDKNWKLTVIAVRIREILETEEHPEKGIYVMPVDGDDLVNCKIAEYCCKHPNPDKPEKFILYISPLCYSKEKEGPSLC